MPGRLAGLAGQLGAAAVQSTGQLLEPVLGQAEAVGAEGVGLDGVRAGLDVLAVDRRDELGPGQDELVQAGALRDAARVEQRAHGAVEQERPAPQPDPEAFALGQDARRGRLGPGSRRRSRRTGWRGATCRWLAWMQA